MATKKEEEKFPFDIGPMYEGERVREKDMFVELAGPKSFGFELVQVVSANELEDGKATVIGPDIKDMKEGERYPYAMIYKVAGKDLEKDLEAVIERRQHELQGYIQGYMHLNQRYDIWIRISKDAVKKGLTSLTQIAKATMKLFKSELPFIEKMEAVYITDEAEVNKRREDAMKVYAARDERARGLHDEDVDTFYGCTLCQSFAPTNVCIVTPDRVSLCGAMTWFDTRASAKVDPEGPNFAVPKGECLDPVGGEYSGINEKAVQLSGGAYSRIKLHSFFEYPHTSCGCFEVIGFYVPELNGLGFVDRGFTEVTPNGLPFSTMAAQTGGGKQTYGFLGIGIGYFRSPKFLQADGGFKKVVWLPKKLKERIKDGIPQDLYDKIATEENATDLASLKKFLEENSHPVVATWKKEEKAEEVPVEVEAEASSAQQLMSMPIGAMGAIPAGGGGIRLILKNAKVKIDKVIVKKS